MIRFVDVGNQIADADPPERDFAFYDTIGAQFITLNTGCTWQSWQEFEDDWRNSDLEGTTWTLERFRGLTPPWVFESR